MSAAPDKPVSATQPAPTVVKPPPLPPRKPRLPPNGLALSESVSVRYSITLSPDVPLKTVLDREFWMHVGRRLQPNFFIDVTCEDGSYYAELYVRSAHATGAQVVILREVPLVGASDAQALTQPRFWVDHKGVNKKYCIMSGDTIVQGGFQTEQDALRAVAEKARELAL
jgi:hypothetical protein